MSRACRATARARARRRSARPRSAGAATAAAPRRPPARLPAVGPHVGGGHRSPAGSLHLLDARPGRARRVAQHRRGGLLVTGAGARVPGRARRSSASSRTRSSATTPAAGSRASWRSSTRARVSHLVLTNTEIPLHRPPWIPMYQALAHDSRLRRAHPAGARSRAFRRSPLALRRMLPRPHAISTASSTQRFVEPLITSSARIEGAMQFLREMKFSRLDEFETLHGQLRCRRCSSGAPNDPTFPEPRAREMVEQFPNVAGVPHRPRREAVPLRGASVRGGGPHRPLPRTGSG